MHDVRRLRLFFFLCALVFPVLVRGEASEGASPPPGGETSRSLQGRWRGDGGEAAPGLEDRNGFYGRYLANRLAIGLGVSSFALREKQRDGGSDRHGNFIGLINHLDEANPVGVFPTCRYRFCRNLGMELTMSRVEAETTNFGSSEGDGKVVAQGPIVNLILECPLWDGRVTPYAGIGYTYQSGSFEERPWWHLDYPSPERYAAGGATKNTLHGIHYREMEVSDDTGPVYSLGVRTRIHRNAELDLMVRYADITCDAEFVFRYPDGTREHSRSGEFPLANTTCGASLRFVF